MVLPRMIMFDYGRTLLYEPGWSVLNGVKALFEYVTSNPLHLTPEEISVFTQARLDDFDKARRAGFEVSNRSVFRFISEYLKLEFSVSLQEAEMIALDGVSRGAVMPGAAEMLEYLKKRGIRTAVISNIGRSEAVLKKRFSALLPDADFEFVIATGEYGLRKPDPLIFGLALRKADLQASEVWFCGDNPVNDVEAPASCGIFPVWYDNNIAENTTDSADNITPHCEHLHIHEWSEMTNLLDKMKN